MRAPAIGQMDVADLDLRVGDGVIVYLMLYQASYLGVDVEGPCVRN